MAEYRFTYAAWTEAFGIFAKYSTDEFLNISVEHDIIYAGPGANIVSDADRERLEKLGWYWSGGWGSFFQYI